MSARIEDVLKINLVLVGIRLLSQPGERAAFDKSVGTEVTEVPGLGVMINIPTGTPKVESSPALTLNRDRITLELIPDRSTITREYPSEDSLNRLVEVASHAIEQSNLGAQHLRAFGFNIEAVYQLTSGETASQFIVNRVFVANLLHAAGYQLIGGSPRLYLRRDGQIWNVNVEPRFGDPNSNRVFASLNLHRDENRIPSRSVINDSLKKVWAEAHSIMKSLDGST